MHFARQKNVCFFAHVQFSRALIKASLQVHLPQENLDKFLQVAKFMRIRGLVKVGEDDGGGGGGGGGGQPLTRTRTSTETEGSRKRAMSFGDDFDDQDDLVKNKSVNCIFRVLAGPFRFNFFLFFCITQVLNPRPAVNVIKNFCRNF